MTGEAPSAGPAESAVASEVGFTWRDLRLAGALTQPAAAAEPTPTVLLLQGSGPADRTSGGFFDEIAPTFHARGIATFAFDKPGCGSSEGAWQDFGLQSRADQARAALAMLRSHPDVDPARLGLWGHSQGGWLAQIVAATDQALAFAASNSGPSIRLPDQDRFGCEHTMRAAGHDDDAIEAALATMQRLHAAAFEGRSYDWVAAQVVGPVEDEPWYGAYFGVVDELDWRSVCSMMAEPHDPLEAVGRIGCPFLAVFGGRDLLVPAWRGAEEIGRALATSPCPDATVTVFPDGDHRLRGDDGEFVPGFLDLLGTWMARQCWGRDRGGDADTA